MEARDICLGYEKGRPLSQAPISFQIPQGAITALMGPNGSGKSTLINTLIGDKSVLKGNLYCYGMEVKTISARKLSTLVSIVPQEHSFPLELRVKHLLELAFLPKGGLLKPIPSIESAEFKPMIESLHLTPLLPKVLKNLSSGERQRIFLARALFQDPKLLILDEPTNHLDPKASSDFWQAVMTYKALKNIDILMSSHDLAFVERECNWILALKNGSLFFNGPKQEFFRSHFSKTLFS